MHARVQAASTLRLPLFMQQEIACLGTRANCRNMPFPVADCVNSSPPLILRKYQGFGGIWANSGKFGKFRENSGEFSGFRGNAGFSGKFGVWGGFG